jgi:hypothetical protein
MLNINKRFSYALRCFFSIISKGEVPEDIAPQLIKPADLIAEQMGPGPKPLESDDEDLAQQRRRLGEVPSDRAVQILALLQREGRLIDFFSEDIASYQDAQIGAAVRELHANCRKALEQYVELEPIVKSEEDGPVTVEVGFDPSTIKIIGNVTGRPPLRGLLRHKGWRVRQVNLPPLSPHEGARLIVAPAEVEIP